MTTTFKSNANWGLTGVEVDRPLAEHGRNEFVEPRVPLVRRLAMRFWAPVPWMLEAAIALQLVTGERLEAGIVAALLIFNVVLGQFQEERANAVLDALKKKLAPVSSVRRDGKWLVLPSALIVPGDLVEPSLGGVVPADVSIVAGAVQLDQSMLTGESAPVDAREGSSAYAGALVRRGNALAQVTATGAHTYFGRTAELVKIARSESSEQRAIVASVRNLAVFNGFVVVTLLIYTRLAGMPVNHVLALFLTAVLASIPVALPATFTLAAALGAKTLAREGVLVTRLSALHEAAAVDLLCVDKTGTLTANTVSVAAVLPLSGEAGEEDVLACAALASADGSLDPVDVAIRDASASHSSSAFKTTTVRSFTPFDPDRKLAEALVETGDGELLRVIKGAPASVAAQAAANIVPNVRVEALTGQGLRVLAVATAKGDAEPRIIGLIGLGDPPRSDSAALIARLRTLGVSTVMVTGDSAPTAKAIAAQVGLGTRISTPERLRVHPSVEAFDIYAEVLPDDKYNLVKAFQESGHVVAMCGDGVNDAPALRHAHAGIAVSTATDVARKAAAMVLTKPGLNGIVSAISEGRCAFERLTTYALNALAKKFQLVLFLAAGVLMTGHALLTPMLMALLLTTGDFITMALTTDRVQPSNTPDRWDMRRITWSAALVAGAQLTFGISIIAIARFRFGMPVDQLRSLAFAALVFSSQAVVYAIRERTSFWRVPPGQWLIVSSLLDIALAFALTTGGILMARLPVSSVVALLGATIVFSLLLSGVKLLVFPRTGAGAGPQGNAVPSPTVSEAHYVPRGRI
ncbi:HAD-IC family P-type ATPase [Paraburkholderia tagetis]|uniref:HAD-IC family P-type ATPase n=1 Tax=Paraburkholderia tagetis TaxID=2913261 RepID=A0A9X1RWZ8_9BURK|nr:HAD-IC family P-type ATPase [Paraburkholderia tagetis]MCG5076699.1 HAD-IC family P-type ATPase [Paraburkholderia tagetis]